MSMVEVNDTVWFLIVVGAVPLTLAVLGALASVCNVGYVPRWTVVMGAVGVLGLVPGVVALREVNESINVEKIEEPIVIESRRIIEGGFDVQTVSRHTGGAMVMPGGAVIPTGSDVTDARYIVMCDGEDGIETLDFSTSGVTVREDAGSWEDARLETVETAVERYTGTFFGMPVEDTRVTGRLWPDYVIHVPEGTLTEANGE